MYRKLLVISVFISLLACQNDSGSSVLSGKKVNTSAELYAVLENVKAGDEIVLANGIWKDIEIKFIGEGEKGKPIILRAETAGEVLSLIHI